jgi:DNA-binding response OmpR family regulator
MDKGTTFSVYLPAKCISRETEGESKMLLEKTVFPADEPEEHQEYDSSKPSILVIDDNADIRNYISQLYADNFFVLEAENGEDGIRKAIQYVPDIIILDVMMPGMSGMECCKVLKGELQTCHIPIIMLTAWAMDDKRIESYRLGADSFIAKPFKSELLTARIDNLLENRARMQSDVVEERADAGNGMVEMDRKFIDKLKRYIIDNMSNPNLDIDSLSEHMALSRTQLYRKVKMLTNYSPNEYIRFLRLRKAMQFLSTSSLNINEICYETGFSSPSYFSKCYKEQFGELPSDYKKRIK